MIYIYCIIQESKEEKVLPEKDVRIISVEPFVVIAKDVLPDEFSEENLKKNFADLNWVDLHVREHIRVITEVMKNRPVIPFKFGTVFLSEENLVKFVEDYSGSLSANFEKIKGREEWSLKVYCDREKLIRHITETNSEIGTLTTTMNQSAPGKAFILKRKIAELVEKEMYILMKINGQEIFNKLSTHCDYTVINNLLPKEATERTDDMILNVSCFIRKEQVNEFFAEAGHTAATYKDAGFIPDISGPWPPFSFISITEIS